MAEEQPGRVLILKYNVILSEAKNLKTKDPSSLTFLRMTFFIPTGEPSL